MWAENFVLFLPINSLKDCQKCLVPLQTNTFNEVIFWGKFSISWFFSVLSEKNPASLSKIYLRWQKNNWGKRLYFEWFDSWYCFLTLNKPFRFLAEIFQQGCQFCNLRVEVINLLRNIFFSNKLSISIFLAFWGRSVWTISEKKSEVSDLHLTCPESKLDEQKFFFGLLTFLHNCSDCNGNTFEIRLNFLFWFLQTALYVSKQKIRKKWLSFESFNFKFFADLERKKASSVIKN